MKDASSIFVSRVLKETVTQSAPALTALKTCRHAPGLRARGHRGVIAINCREESRSRLRICVWPDVFSSGSSAPTSLTASASSACVVCVSCFSEKPLINLLPQLQYAVFEQLRSELEESPRKVADAFALLNAYYAFFFALPPNISCS